MTESSAWACSTVAPGLSRPMPKTVLPSLAISTVRGRGSIISTPEPGVKTEAKSNSGGSTPTIVVGLLLSEIVRPTAEGSPLKWRIQKAYVRMATCGPLNAHSSFVKLRPWSRRTPSVGRKSMETA